MNKDPLDLTRFYRELERIHYKYPELRFCQLIENVLADYLNEHSDSFYVTDEKFLEYLREWDKWMESNK